MGLFGANKLKDEYYEAVNNNYAVISFKIDGTILEANNNFLQALGYTLSEIVGKHHKIFCDESYVNSLTYKEFWNNLSKGYVQTADFKRFKKDGSVIFIRASYSPIKDSGGKVYKVMKFAQDITEQKLQELYFEGQLNAISKSQAVIEFNMDGTIISANENFLHTVGYTLEEIQGKHHKIFCDAVYQSSSDYIQFWKDLNKGEFKGGEFHRIGKNEQEIWIQATYNPIFDINNKPYKVVKYATNITDRKRKMFEIEESIKHLSESLSKLSSSSNNMQNEAQATVQNSEKILNRIVPINDSVSNITSQIETMLNAISKIVESSSHANQISTQAQQKSKETTSDMLKLNEESQKIGETINIITQIAFQTNILSLNAAVEAATAGEAGKGFAVVAQEVRNLATRSDEAAKEITSAIESIQTLIQASLNSINTIDSTIETISEVSSKMTNIIHETQSISHSVASITNEASSDLNNITVGMDDLVKSAELSGSESNKNANVSKELIETSNKLIDKISSLQ